MCGSVFCVAFGGLLGPGLIVQVWGYYNGTSGSLPDAGAYLWADDGNGANLLLSGMWWQVRVTWIAWRSCPSLEPVTSFSPACCVHDGLVACVPE